MKTTTRLWQLLHTGPMVVAPFIPNAMHAKIAEAVGFPAVYMTGVAFPIYDFSEYSCTFPASTP
jgi:2-methylisocitrate lyase-like PEP mutase family enzyme